MTTANQSGYGPLRLHAPHRIVSKPGNGGMGVVYRATDTRLNRHVAIKNLAADARTQRCDPESS